MNVRVVALLAGLAFFVLTANARADREKAAAAYKAATTAFAQGAFTDAATLFETAQAEDPRGPNVYNAALSWQSAREYARAADDFVRALASPDLPAELNQNARTQLAKLEPILAKVSIEGPSGARATVAHAHAAVPADVHLKPGHWVVHVTYSDGDTGDFPVNAAAGASVRLDVTPRPVTAAVVPPPPSAPIEPHPSVPMTGALGAPTLAVGIAMIATGVVTGGISVGLGVAALASYNQYKQSGLTSRPEHDSAVTLRDWTNATLIAALVLGAAGITLAATVHRVKVQVGVGSLSLVF